MDLTLPELLGKLSAIGVRIEAHGERLKVTPADGVTPELRSQLVLHKPALLGLAHAAAAGAAVEILAAPPGHNWTEASEIAAIMEIDAGLPRDEAERRAGLVVEASDRCADAAEADPILIDPDGWPVGSIHPNELTPCPICGSLELWQPAAGDLFGREPARWRCQKCEPPETARRLRAKAERIKNRMRTRPVDESGRTGSTPSTPNLSR